ncbi:hypothetical protein M8818_006923 [Zalaria obscura]|uniref:Uncharacterized protein n=1 Tax=Zalaria obscura TaxID=2024903 RepID=A0ACC3S597_9PEZI
MATEEFQYSKAKGLMVLNTPLLKACSACERAGKQAECSSTNDQFARGKERSYVATLETQVEKLERKIREAQQRKSSVVSLPDQDADVPARPPPTHAEPNQASAKALRRKEAHAIDELVSDFGFLTVNATARDYYGFTSAMSYARLILSACSKDQFPAGLTTALPPRHLASITIQHYFDNTFSLLPLFDEASFYASVDAVYNSGANRGSGATAFDHWCVRLVLAIAEATLSEQRGDPHYMEAVGHVSAALVYAEQVLFPGAISSVQAILLLVEYAMLDPHHLDSWGLIGAASRAMVDLGLHQDPPKGTPISKAKLDLRRRVFYCVYALDRSTSLVQTRAFSFSDDSTHVSVPYSSSSSSRSNSVGHAQWLSTYSQASNLIKLRKIQSVWYMDLFQSGREPWPSPYPYLWRTCQHMKAWFDGISSNTKPHFRTFFEIDLLYSYIYVLAPSPRVPVVAPFAQNLIFEYCIRYAELVTRIVGDRKYLAPLTFYDAMRVYMTGRQFIDVLWLNQDRLLSGVVPEPPHVPVDSEPPPRLPQPLDPLVNINRSITCIKQLTDCLGSFGMRWGYMSWRDRFAKDAEPMVTALNQRIWEMQQDSASSISGTSRRPGYQHTNSSGSTPSEALSPDYTQGRQYTPGTTTYPSPGYGQQSYGQSGVALQGHMSQGQVPSFEGQQQQQQQQQQPYYAAPPTQQFAAWTGMSMTPPFDDNTRSGADADEYVPPSLRTYHTQ